MRTDTAEVVRSAAAQLPLRPGVYRFRDARGRALYLGRAVSLRRRVASYWSGLRDRPYLSAMVRAIASVEAVECASEHEAAWLERSLLEQQLLPWNRTAGGQEVEVYLRLDSAPRSAGLTVMHDAHGCGAAVQYFGPYLGGLRVRLAAAALLRAYPLDYAADSAGTGGSSPSRTRGSPPSWHPGTRPEPRSALEFPGVPKHPRKGSIVTAMPNYRRGCHNCAVGVGGASPGGVRPVSGDCEWSFLQISVGCCR